MQDVEVKEESLDGVTYGQAGAELIDRRKGSSGDKARPKPGIARPAEPPVFWVECTDTRGLRAGVVPDGIPVANKSNKGQIGVRLLSYNTAVLLERGREGRGRGERKGGKGEGRKGGREGGGGACPG